jgi:hypothetical protein
LEISPGAFFFCAHEDWFCNFLQVPFKICQVVGIPEPGFRRVRARGGGRSLNAGGESTSQEQSCALVKRVDARVNLGPKRRSGQCQDATNWAKAKISPKPEPSERHAESRAETLASGNSLTSNQLRSLRLRIEAKFRSAASYQQEAS